MENGILEFFRITYGVLEFRSVWAGLNLLTLTLAWTLYKPIGLCFFRVGPLTTLILTLPPLASRWRLYSRGELPMNSWPLISHHASFSLSLTPQHSSNPSILRPKSQSIFLSCWSPRTFSSGACYMILYKVMIPFLSFKRRRISLLWRWPVKEKARES